MVPNEAMNLKWRALQSN